MMTLLRFGDHHGISRIACEEGVNLTLTYIYKQWIISQADIDSVKETYVCDKCGENFCDCHKEET